MHGVHDPLLDAVPVIVPSYPGSHKQSVAAVCAVFSVWSNRDCHVEECTGQITHSAVLVRYLYLPEAHAAQIDDDETREEPPLVKPSIQRQSVMSSLCTGLTECVGQDLHGSVLSAASLY